MAVLDVTVKRLVVLVISVLQRMASALVLKAEGEGPSGKNVVGRRCNQCEDKQGQIVSGRGCVGKSVLLHLAFPSTSPSVVSLQTLCR